MTELFLLLDFGGYIALLLWGVHMVQTGVQRAYGKALGLGLRAPMTLLSLQVLNDVRGRPVAHPRKALADYVREQGLVAHVSLSDEVDSAVAFVIIERKEGG